MKKQLPAYVYRRKGGLLYFERRGWKSTRIYAEPGTPEFAAQYAAILKAGQLAPAGKTFKDLVASYRLSREYSLLAPRTVKDYEKVLAWVEAKLGTLPVAGMKARDVYRAQAANSDQLRFANYIVQVLRILFKHARRMGLREDNPAAGVPLFRSDKAERKPWPAKLIAAYRAEAKDNDLLLFELLLGLGQRIGDTLKLRWADIEDGGIWLRQSKTKKGLFVPFTARLQAVLDATPRRGLTIIAHGKMGKPWAYKTAQQHMMDIRTKIGARDYDQHSLRYTTADELAGLGLSDEHIASITGHDTLDMVRKYAGARRQITRAKEAQERRE